MGSHPEPLSQLEVMAVDCQATAAAPRGHLIELKRLIAAGAPVALRLGVGPALDESRLASALWWV